MSSAPQAVERASPPSPTGEAGYTAAAQGPSFGYLLALFLFLHVTIMVSMRVYPFVDIPNHLALATVNRHYAAANEFANYYTMDLVLRPNVFHLVFCSLPIFPSVEFANRVFYGLYIALFPVAALVLVRRVGGNPWYALLAFLVACNQSVVMGFVGFTLAVPLVLLTFACMIGTIDTGRGHWMLAALFVLLFFVHVLGLLFAGLLFILALALEVRRGPRWIMRQLLPLVPAGLLVLAWKLTEVNDAEHSGSMLASMLYYYRAEYLGSILRRLELLVSDNRHLAIAAAGMGISVLAFGVVVACLLGGIVRRLRAATLLPLPRGTRWALLFTVAGAGCFFLLPEYLPGYSFIFQRFSVPFILGMIILAACLSRGAAHSRMPAVICLCVALQMMLWAVYLYGFDRENRSIGIETLPSDAAPGTLAGVVFDPYYRGYPSRIHMADYYVVWKKGIVAMRTLDARSFPIARRGDKRSLPRNHEWVRWWVESDGFDPRHYDDLDYLLVCGEIPMRARDLLAGFVLEKQDGPWVLYRRHSIDPEPVTPGA